MQTNTVTRKKPRFPGDGVAIRKCGWEELQRSKGVLGEWWLLCVYNFYVCQYLSKCTI